MDDLLNDLKNIINIPYTSYEELNTRGYNFTNKLVEYNSSLTPYQKNIQLNIEFENWTAFYYDLFNFLLEASKHLLNKEFYK